MSVLIRSLYICKPVAHTPKVCYIPELSIIQCVLTQLTAKTHSDNLRSIVEQLVLYQQQYGLGAMPYDYCAIKVFFEELYNELLINQISLPPLVGLNDIPYIFKNHQAMKQQLIPIELKLNIQRKYLGDFAYYLPILGPAITVIICLGMTISAMVMISSWDISIALFFVFAASKWLSNYADIAGGPDKRLERLGLWMDRQISGDYAGYGLYPWSRLALDSLAIVSLGCSTFVSWISSWKLIQFMSGMEKLSPIMTTTLAGAFATASAGASFGRIYQNLHQLLFDYFSPYISFDPYKPEEKIDGLLFNYSKVTESSTLSTPTLIPAKLRI